MNVTHVHGCVHIWSPEINISVLRSHSHGFRGHIISLNLEFAGWLPGQTMLGLQTLSQQDYLPGHIGLFPHPGLSDLT